jgi:hypothetical protein
VDRPSGADVTSDRRVVAGRYALLAPLGSGGMGTVWRAEDLVLGREVAVKEVSFPHGLSDEDREVLRERTRREARAAARLDHPSAVTVYDVVEQDGSPYLVMELVEARTLAEVVRSDGPLPPAQAAEVGLAVLGALEAAHAQGIVHRDVKPGNVLLRTGATGVSRVVLTDFGIATSAGDSSITSTGLLLGSPSYIAPERARGHRPGPPSDLWALGATMFTAVEGRPPYDAGDPMATVTAVVTGDHAPFVAAGPLEPVIRGLLEKDPEQRLDAGRARRLLEGVVRAGELPTTAPRPAAPADALRADRTTALPIGPALHERTEQAAPAAAAPALVATRAVTAATTRAGTPPPTVTRPVTRAAEPGIPVARPPRPPSRRRSPAVPLMLALVLLAATALGAVLLLTDAGGSALDRDADPGASQAAPEASEGTAGDTSGPDAGSGSGQDGSSGQSSSGPSSVAAPPEGWTRIEGDAGWSGAVPPSYTAGSFNDFPQYKDPETGRTLRVSYTAPGGGKDDAVQDRRDQAEYFASRHDDYSEITIEQADYRSYEAADWEFTYDEGGTDLHVLNRVFVVDGRGYSLYFQTRGSDDWDEARAEFEQILATFSPA